MRKRDPLAQLRLINKLQHFTKSEITKLALPIRLSFDAIKNGRGTEQDYHDIAAAINVTTVRSESVGLECIDVSQAATNALIRTWERYQRIGKLGFDGIGISDVESAIDLHEQFLRESTPLQMINAQKEVIKRIDDAQRKAA